MTIDERLLLAVEAFRRGRDREGAFRTLYTHFHPPVRRFFARKGLSPETCLDLTQDVFLGVYNGLDGFRGDAQLSTWVFRIARTTYLKHLRRNAADKRSGHEVAAEDAPAGAPGLTRPAGQLDTVLGDERRRALRRAVRSLPEQMRRCLRLRLDQGLKYREIADAMDVSIDTVKTHLFQARHRLREELADLADEALEPAAGGAP
jgi:RNA polymerase sigma factor (sigma-70 family)